MHLTHFHRPLMWTMIVTTTLGLAACGDETKEKLGLARRAPDAFAVVTRAPLELPPDYALRPPVPGAPRPQDEVPSDTAEKTLLGDKPAAKKTSKIENVLLQKTGADQTDPAIRSEITTDGETDDDSNLPVGTHIFGIGKDANKDVIDPVAEKERLEKEKQEKTAK